MIPINVTHTAIVTRPILSRLLAPESAPAPIGGPLPTAATTLRHMLSTLIGFFAESYKSTFGFVDGPPLHDALTIAYIEKPELFSCKRYRVDVELAGTHTAGETVVDMFNYRSVDISWGRHGKNCLVAEKLDVCSCCLICPALMTLTLRCRLMDSSTCSWTALRDAIWCRLLTNNEVS